MLMGGGEGRKAVPKKGKCCDKPEGWGSCPPCGGLIGSFFADSLDTTVAPVKDVQRPVCTKEMFSFVVPTLLYFLESLSGGFYIGWNPVVWGPSV